MCLPNPFSLHDDQVVIALQEIFNFIFPEDKQPITGDDPVKYVVRNSIIYKFMNLSCIYSNQADQRFLEHRGRCAEYAFQVVKDLLEREENRDELLRRDFVSQALKSKKNPAFIWMNFMSESYDSVSVFYNSSLLSANSFSGSEKGYI